MNLLTKKLRQTLPPLYSQENAEDATVHAKYFTSSSNWTWFVTEGTQQEDGFLCFGYVIGLEEEWGYFLMSELEAVRGPMGLPIERDLYFRPGLFSEVIKRYRHERGK